MNIFWLDRYCDNAARYHDDSRIVKMVVEAAQCIAAGLRIRARDPLSDIRLREVEAFDVYDPFNMDNALPHWCAESQSHMKKVHGMVFELDRQYRGRFDSEERHESAKAVKRWLPLIRRVPEHGWRDPPFYGPDEYDTGNLVDDYRRYFAYEKGDNATYAAGEVPEWWPDDAPQPTTHA